MITLRTSLGSPFGRKARIAIIHLGLQERVRFEPGSTSDPDDPVHALNPLRKSPALDAGDGVAIYDSPVILEYLDWLAGGGKIIPHEPKARFRALTLQALADGLTEAAVLIVYEDRWRNAAQRSEPWLAHQRKKVDSALSWLEKAPPSREKVDVGQIALACALSFCDRIAPEGWRDAHPGLAQWLQDFAGRVPAFVETAS